MPWRCPVGSAAQSEAAAFQHGAAAASSAAPGSPALIFKMLAVAANCFFDPMPCRERLRTLALRRGEVLGQTLDPAPVDLPGRRAKSLLRIRLARGELLDLLLGTCRMPRFGRPRPAFANNL